MCVVHLSGLLNPRPSLSSIAATSPPSDLALARGFGHFCVQLLLDASVGRGRLYTGVSASDLGEESGYLEFLGINILVRTVLCLEKFGVGRQELNLEKFPSRSKSGDLRAGVNGTLLKGCG